MLTPNTPIPRFSVKDQDGTLVTEKTFLGSWIVLYFYPRDETPGCTVEACSFRDTSAELATLGAKVYGVSKDTVKSHQKFRKNHKLPFPLLADVDHSMAEAFDVWVEKSMYGKKYMGMDRNTYIINPEGEIAASFEKVNPLTHTKEVLEALTALKNA